MINNISKKTWIVDIDASFSMIDDLELFKKFLKLIKRRVIKIEKKKLYSNKCDLTRVQNKKKKTRLITTFYVSNLKINFFSIKRLCEMKLQKSFDENDFYMRDKHEQLTLKISICNDVYIIDKIIKKLNEIILIATMIDEMRNIFMNVENIMSFTKSLFIELSMTNVESNSQIANNDSYENFEINVESSSFNVSTFKLKKYRLWHRRFAHMRKTKLNNLHNVTTLKKLIFIVENFVSCKVCCIIKLINFKNKRLAIRKSFILIFVFIDICEKLSISWKNYRYFLKIVNNYSRKTWIIFLKKRSNAVKTLRKWRFQIELKTNVKLLIVRNDNVLKLKNIFDEWNKTSEIEIQYIKTYISKQNDVFERDIRITKNNIRIMIKKVDLFIEFWAKTTMIDNYIRNRVEIDFVVNDEKTTSIKTFENVKSFIDHIRTWNCVYYSFVNFKFLLIDIKKNKFMNRDRRCVFLKYVKKIEKQYWMWFSNLRKVFKHHKVRFSKNEKWENEKLNLFFQTANELSIKRFVERFKKTSMLVANDASKNVAKNVAENQIKFQILSKSTTKHASHLFNQKIDQQFIQNKNNFDFMKIEKKKHTMFSNLTRYMKSLNLTKWSSRNKMNFLHQSKITQLKINQFVNLSNNELSIILTYSFQNELVLNFRTMKMLTNIETKCFVQWLHCWFTKNQSTKTTNDRFRSQKFSIRNKTRNSLFSYQKHTTKSSKIQFEKNYDWKSYKQNSSHWSQMKFEKSLYRFLMSISWSTNECLKSKCTLTKTLKNSKSNSWLKNFLKYETLISLIHLFQQ